MTINVGLRLIGGSLLALTALAVVPATVSAQTAQPGQPGQALEISPPVVTLSANPGDTKTIELKLRDIAPAAIIVTGEANDFIAAGEDGTPKLLLDAGEKSPYSIRDWFQPLAPLNLLPQQIKTFPVTLKIPADASPGGHYGVIRFTAKSADPTGNAVSLNASLGTLILVNISGDIKNKLAIEEFYLEKGGKKGWFFESTPVNFVERLKNEGNTHEQPKGKVTVKDMFGKLVAAQLVNEPPRNILPESIRKFSQELGPALIGDKRLFGKYTADLELTYANDQKLTASQTFWIVPYRLIAAAIIGLVGAFFLLRYLIKRYNQNLIRGSRGRRRR